MNVFMNGRSRPFCRRLRLAFIAFKAGVKGGFLLRFETPGPVHKIVHGAFADPGFPEDLSIRKHMNFKQVFNTFF